MVYFSLDEFNEFLDRFIASNYFTWKILPQSVETIVNWVTEAIDMSLLGSQFLVQVMYQIYLLLERWLKFGTFICFHCDILHKFLNFCNGTINTIFNDFNSSYKLILKMRFQTVDLILDISLNQLWVDFRFFIHFLEFPGKVCSDIDIFRLYFFLEF